ncbi:hypothetical protein Syun_003732 [Stephania yunnanensis]|uniref:Uncharacterized protein n=1 Tax=Stephania yunnanensis TaxID=152371 RepID=A0AAP0L2P6_9MAGN
MSLDSKNRKALNTLDANLSSSIKPTPLTAATVYDAVSTDHQQRRIIIHRRPPSSSSLPASLSFSLVATLLFLPSGQPLLFSCSDLARSGYRGGDGDGDVEARSWRREAVGARQSGKPGEMGRPTESPTRGREGRRSRTRPRRGQIRSWRGGRDRDRGVAEVGDAFVGEVVEGGEAGAVEEAGVVAAAKAALVEKRRRLATRAGVRRAVGDGKWWSTSAVGDGRDT